MKSRKEVLEAVKAGRKSKALDGRDYSRLTDFFPVKDWNIFGFEIKDGKEAPRAKSWTEKSVLAQLKEDVDFGFEKALDKRGLSAAMMNSVVSMWMWVLDDELQYYADYAHYGLPLLKATAEKYGFDNPIGTDAGNEHKYSTYGD